ISAVLLIIWLVAVFLFDRQTYWVFRPGQVEGVEQIGGGGQNHRTNGKNNQDPRGRPFPDWVFGGGAGRPGGGEPGGRKPRVPHRRVRVVQAEQDPGDAARGGGRPGREGQPVSPVCSFRARRLERA